LEAMPKRKRDGSTPHIAALREMWPVATIYRSSHRYAIEMMFTDGIWSKRVEAADGALPVKETGI
jgi:hypothetical protein